MLNIIGEFTREYPRPLQISLNVVRQMMPYPKVAYI